MNTKKNGDRVSLLKILEKINEQHTINKIPNDVEKKILKILDKNEKGMKKYRFGNLTYVFFDLSHKKNTKNCRSTKNTCC